MSEPSADPRFQADVACAYCRDREANPVRLLVVRHTALLETMPATTSIAAVRHVSSRAARRRSLTDAGVRWTPGKRTRELVEPMETPAPAETVIVTCRVCRRPRHFQLRRVLEQGGERAMREGFYVTVYI